MVTVMAQQPCRHLASGCCIYCCAVPHAHSNMANGRVLRLWAHVHACTGCDKEYQCDGEDCSNIREQPCAACLDGEWWEG